jgi:hypothetical protein
MANINGKAYALTAFTRSHPAKTLMLRVVFALIGLSLKPLWVSTAVAGAALGAAVSLLFWIGWGLTFASRRVAGAADPSHRFAPDLLAGSWVGLHGAAGLLAGIAMLMISGALLALVVTRWYRPTWTILGKVRQVQANLIELSFIHYARWAIIRRGDFPRLSPSQPAEDLAYDYMLFESNFNGDWEKYIDAFSEVVPGGMDNIWRWSVRYPGSRPITPFLTYIRNCQYDTDHYYSAYPGASTNDLLGALRLSDELEALQRTAGSTTPEQFAAAYDAFLLRVQNCLATTGVPPYPSERAGAPVAMGTATATATSTVHQGAA